MLRKSGPADVPGVHRLLRAAQLPLDGLETHHDRLWVWDEAGVVLGAIAFEQYGPDGLLRSLVVDPSHRGAGLGRLLLQTGLDAMRAAGVQQAYGLTTTIPDWLERLGWTEVRKPDLPAALNASMELRGACPDTARVFHTSLA